MFITSIISAKCLLPYAGVNVRLWDLEMGGFRCGPRNGEDAGGGKSFFVWHVSAVGLAREDINETS